MVEEEVGAVATAGCNFVVRPASCISWEINAYAYSWITRLARGYAGSGGGYRGFCQSAHNFFEKEGTSVRKATL